MWKNDFSSSNLEDASHLGYSLSQDVNSTVQQNVETTMFPFVGDNEVSSFVQDNTALVPFEESTGLDDA